MAKRTKTKQKRIARTIYLPKADHEIVQTIARTAGHTFTAIIRDIVREYVNRVRRGE